MPKPIHKMTDAELATALDEADTAYMQAESGSTDEDSWGDQLEALEQERDARADGSEMYPHDEHIGLSVPAGYSS